MPSDYLTKCADIDIHEALDVRWSRVFDSADNSRGRSLRDHDDLLRDRDGPILADRDAADAPNAAANLRTHHRLHLAHRAPHFFAAIHLSANRSCCHFSQRNCYIDGAT